MRARLLLLAGLAVAGACSSSRPPVDGGPPSDAGPADAADGAAHDAGVPPDAPGPVDLGAPDSPPPDLGRPAVCGDHVLEPPEQCDDGNTADGDGCSATCDLEPAFCPPGDTAMPIAAGATVTGDTSSGGRASGTAGSCGGGSAPEDVYTFTLTVQSDVTLTTDLPATSFDTAVYVRSPCGDRLGQLGCQSGGPLGDTLTLSGVMPGTYFVFVDGVVGTRGTYSLQLTTSPDIADGSPCDPSGASGHCLPRSVCAGGVCTSASAVCAAAATDLTPGTAVSDTTVGGMDLYGPACSSDGNSPERVYHVNVAGTHDLVVTATPTRFATDAFDIVLTVESSCGDASTSLGCSDSPGAMSVETVTVTGASGDYYILVDGYGSSPTDVHAGMFSLVANLR